MKLLTSNKPVVFGKSDLMTLTFRTFWSHITRQNIMLPFKLKLYRKTCWKLFRTIVCHGNGTTMMMQSQLIISISLYPVMGIVKKEISYYANANVFTKR